MKKYYYLIIKIIITVYLNNLFLLILFQSQLKNVGWKILNYLKKILFFNKFIKLYKIR